MKMKTNLLWMSILLLMLAECNSDDSSIEINEQNLLGRWQYAGTNLANDMKNDYIGGFYFQKNGTIKSWQLIEGKYDEVDWGFWWFDDKGTLYIKAGSKEPIPDELYYKVISMSESELVIRVYGGVAGIPFERGEDKVYFRSYMLADM